MLEDLNELAVKAKEKCNKYNQREFIFSDAFKSKFNELLPDYGIEFHKYTSVVKTKGNNLLIIVPNQWFVIGSFFSDFIVALRKYKKAAENIKITDAKIKTFRDEKIIDEKTEADINSYFTEPKDQANFKKFLTNYSWWFGSKTIDRSDYFVSPVLNLAGVVNVTQTYIADLAWILSDHQDLIKIFEQDYDSIEKKNILETKIRVSEKDLKHFAFKSFKVLLEKYGYNKVIKNSTEKDSTINDQEYIGIKIKSYFGSGNLIGVFEKEQKKETLSSANTQRFFEENLQLEEYPYSYFTTQWGDVDGGTLSFKNLQKFIIDISSGDFEVNKIGDNYSLIQKIRSNNLTLQKIYYGAPGTGKSHKIETILKDISEEQKERITFHPEYDYSSFVGGYKPSSEINEENGKFEITYKFVPQVFTNIYVEAWKNPLKDYYLAIEEINRGNCAEIFGDLFQLLDRNSNYSISPSKELKEHLKSVLIDEKGIEGGKMKLPLNLNILASMNTSDQSLFPMDSAFKRRWAWEYIPINDEEFNSDATETKKATKNDSFEYTVKIDDTQSFKWIKFIKNVNDQIKSNRNLGSDKCIGNYFIKPENKEISLDEFINKVVFYLWIDVFKDEEESIFSLIGKNISYEDFFPINTKGKENLIKLLETLNVAIEKIELADTKEKIEIEEEIEEEI